MGIPASQQLNLTSDPSVVQRQILADREKAFAAITNPQQQFAARLGGMLGGGIANLTQDKGFFDINDPLLNKVSKIQGIYNQVASQIDPAANPEQFFTALQKAYSQDPELGQQALMAAQEAQKARTTSTELQLKEAQLYEKSPELIPAKIEQALKDGNEAEAMRLANLKTRIDETRNLDITKTKAEIARINAQTNEVKDRIESGKYDWKVITNAFNAPIGVQTINKKTGEVQFKEVDPEIAKKFLQFGEGKPVDGKGSEKKDKPALSSFATGGGQPAAAAPAQQTTWSGVPVIPKPVVPPTPTQERDYAIQRAMPNVNVSLLNEQQKAVLAQQLGL